MICPKCSYGMTQLFLTWACDRCDGLLPGANAPVCEGGEGCWIAVYSSSKFLTQRVRNLFYGSATDSLDDIRAVVKSSAPHPAPVAYVCISGKPTVEPLTVIWTEDQRKDPADRIVLNYFIVT